MKIGDSISNYYRPHNGSQLSGKTSPMSVNSEGGGGQRSQAPTVSVGMTGPSSSLSSALWLSMADKFEGDNASVGDAPAAKSASDEFMDFSKLSLAEKIRAQILGGKDLTEDDLAHMDADARAAIEAEIKEAIKRQLDVPQDGSVEAAEASGLGRP
ncbi:hypothetical protein [Pararhizobium qamdonense]|uniref:hypothetical protein n=1 Tax=Pararhizobium qamdonense TaxID=3031126 RepID=UPI0023E11C53|nr:hypothetical protein [Pararhizobium qamdonense]